MLWDATFPKQISSFTRTTGLAPFLNGRAEGPMNQNGSHL
jgi:hypothetical protein